MILSWQENLPEKDQPPRWMWAVDEELDQWFTRLRENRGGGVDRDDFDDESMTSNEFATGRRT